MFFVSSPLVSCVSMWSMLVAFLGHTHLFRALLYLVLLDEINKTESVYTYFIATNHSNGVGSQVLATLVTTLPLHIQINQSM